MPTSGTIAMMFLLHHCAKVDLYGFKGDDLKKWYFCKHGTRPKASMPDSAWLKTRVWDVNDWTYVDTPTMEPGHAAEAAEEALPFEYRLPRDVSACTRAVRTKQHTAVRPSMGMLRSQYLEEAFLDDLKPAKRKDQGKRGVGGGTTGLILQHPSTKRKVTNAQRFKRSGRSIGRRLLLHHDVSKERDCHRQLESIGLLTIVN